VIGPADVARAWKEAQALWDVAVTLSPPEALAKKGAGHWGGSEPLAYIDLVARQVVVNFELLGTLGAEKSLTAVLAHELGHHVRFPHTLGLAAQLRVLEQRLIPGLAQSLTNLFFDLQVNEVVGRTRADDLCAVYRGFVAQAKEGQVSPLFWFYLATYEELWGRKPGELAPSSMAEAIEQEFPGARAEARMFAQTFWTLDDVYLQFVYFCSRFIRYAGDPAKLSYRFPLGGDVADPGVDDWGGAIYGNEQVGRAIEEAEQRGWIDAGGEGDDPLRNLDTISRHLPGAGQGPFVQTLVSRHYKRLVDRHLIEIPPIASKPEPLVPTVLEDWEHGEDPEAIDWTASVLARGAMAAVMPLRRELEPEPPAASQVDVPSMEIYLDTSGSMPNPAASLNVMTLAAQILAAATIRHRGRVRAIVYSHDFMLSPWMYDEEGARQFLLRYAGGGTQYPWKVLKRLADERGDVFRVIISDSDFLSNCAGKEPQDILAYATRRSIRTVAMLAVHEQWLADPLKSFGPAWTDDRFRLVNVERFDAFAEAASALARVLFGK
jgi:hypothetical protein